MSEPHRNDSVSSVPYLSTELERVIRPTTFLDAPRLRRKLGVEITLATETFQYTGSFKFRAAYNFAAQVPHPHIITASSGNFGQAMAYACQLLGKACTVVMPDTSAQVKIEAVREFGGEVDLISVEAVGRSERVAQLARQFPDACVASAYDDPLIIAGNASLGLELAKRAGACDTILAPIGGGGLASGIITGLCHAGASLSVIGAEPLLANDAARSLRAGKLLQNDTEPQTIADGTRTLSLGQHNWNILRTGLAEIIEIPEEAIREATRLLFTFANLKAEPTGALSLAALLTAPERFHNSRVCCVVSGGNVDPNVYREILSA